MTRTFFRATLLALALHAGPALAGNLVDTIVGDLRAQGYDRIDISRTLLGRTRIEAQSDGYLREIILDPRTGEILRDYWEVLTDAAGQPLVTGTQAPSVVGPGPGGGSSGPGPGVDDDDDDDDNSGSGSGGGNSGSGSNSGSGGSGGGDDDDD